MGREGQEPSPRDHFWGGRKEKTESFLSPTPAPPRPPPCPQKEKDECHPGTGSRGLRKEQTSSRLVMPFGSSALL